MKKLFALAVALFIATQTFAVQYQEDQVKLVSFDFPDAPLSVVLDAMSVKTGNKFITDRKLAAKRIYLKLRGVTPPEALDVLLNMYNLYYVRQAGTSIYVIKERPDSMNISLVSKVFFLNYASAEAFQTVVSANLSASGKVVTDKRTNSLVVSDMADNIDKIEALIRSLDIPTMQVLLEAKIVDIKMDKEMDFGTEITNIYRTSTLYQDPLSSILINEPQVGFNTSGLAPGVSGSGKLDVAIISGDYNIQGFVEALQTESNAKLLSNPRLLVLNNKSASIDIIEEIPYQEKTETSEGGDLVSTSFKEVGIKLSVLPQINRDGSIILQVTPEQSFRTGETIDNIPVVSTSKVSTTFTVRDGETAVIGGLIRETESTSEHKVPLFGDIPLLGFLFKKYSNETVRTELTILITAKVVEHQ